MFLLLGALEGQIFCVWRLMFFWTYRTNAIRPYPFFWTNAIRPYKKKIHHFYFGMDGGKIFFLPLLLCPKVCLMIFYIRCKHFYIPLSCRISCLVCSLFKLTHNGMGICAVRLFKV